MLQVIAVFSLSTSRLTVENSLQDVMSLIKASLSESGQEDGLNSLKSQNKI